MEHLKIIFEHSEEVHGYEHRITKDINNTRGKKLNFSTCTFKQVV